MNFFIVGTSYFIPLVGGWISDSIAGRFNTIYGSGLLYILGTTLLPFIALDYGAVFGTDSHGNTLGMPLVKL